MSDKPPIFVVGCDRSGTTLFSIALNRLEGLHMTLESGFIPSLASQNDTYGDFTQARQRWYLIRDLQRWQATSKTYAFDVLDVTEDEAERALAECSPTDYAGAVDALFSASASKFEKSRWGNKTPGYVEEIDAIHALFPNAQFIHLLRDPRDVASSLIKAGWFDSYYGAAHRWQKRVSTGLQQGRRLPDDQYLEVKYECLLQDPEMTMRKVCDWISEPFSPHILETQEVGTAAVADAHENLFPLLNKPIDPSRAYNWRQSLTYLDVAEVEQVTRSLMQRVGYPTSNIRYPVQRRIARWSHDIANRLKKSLHTLVHR